MLEGWVVAGYIPRLISLHQGLHELETYIPARMLEPKIRLPQKPLKLNYQQRQDASVQRDLKAINELLDTAKFTKGSRGVGECWPAPLADVVDKSRSMTQKRSTTRPTGEANRVPVDQYLAVIALARMVQR